MWRKYSIALICLCPLYANADTPDIYPNSLSLSASQEQWIHYDRFTTNLEFSTITSLGFFGLQAARENGEGKIFSELNIGGFSQVANNPWKTFDASRFGIKYGFKAQLGGGLVKGGIGAQQYDGSTDCQVDGCKDIESWGWGGEVTWKQKTENEWKVKYKHHSFVPTQWHPLSVSPLPLIQRTKLNQAWLELERKTSSYRAQVEYLGGKKSDSYSVLIPSNNIHFQKYTLGFFPRIFSLAGPLDFGPLICAGTGEGSIAQLNLTRCLGVKLYLDASDHNLSVAFLTETGTGSAYFSEFDIHEDRTKHSLTLEYKSGPWEAAGFYSREIHSAAFSIYDPTLAFIVGGVRHNNKRTIKEYGITLKKVVSKQLTLSASLQGIDAIGNFYTNPALDESGWKLELGLKQLF